MKYVGHIWRTTNDGRGVVRGQKVGGVKWRSADSLQAYAKTMNTRGVAGQGVQGSDPPPAPEATRESSENPIRNAPGWVCRWFLQKICRKTHNANIQYFILKRITQIRKMSAWMCTACIGLYIRKTVDASYI